MSVTTTDLRSKAVLSTLIDKVSTLNSVSSIFTDLGAALAFGESIDIGTTDTVTVSQAHTSGAPNQMTIQSATNTANNLVVDKTPGAFLEIPKLSRIFDLEGAFASQKADQILTTIEDAIDQDCVDALLTAAWDNGATPAYWINAAAATVTAAMTFNAMATMLAQKGVRKESCAWMMHPFGAASIASLADFKPYTGVAGSGAPSAFGAPFIGTLYGIPVIENQSIRNRFTVATTQVVVASNVATATVAAGHNIVSGMKLTSAGHTANASSAVTVGTVTATTIAYPLVTGDATLADGVGTLTIDATCNALVYKPWTFIRRRQLPEIRVVPRVDYDSDVLQATSLYGRKCLAGSAVFLGSPRNAI
jgi:hypothetical protein